MKTSENAVQAKFAEDLTRELRSTPLLRSVRVRVGHSRVGDRIVAYFGVKLQAPAQDYRDSTPGWPGELRRSSWRRAGE